MIQKLLVASLSLIFFASCGTAHKTYNSKIGVLDRLLKFKGRAKPKWWFQSKNGKLLVSEMRVKDLRKKAELRWPLKKPQLTSAFGKRNGRMHEGIDLRARVGTPVYAAHSGKVVYSGSRIRGYGKMIVLRHKTGLVTVYAHHRRNLVRSGQRVKIGQKIAYSGKTGRITGPHLHFEVRDGATPFNPMRVMPPRRHRLARHP